MAEKEVKVKVSADVDKSDVEDLEQTLQRMQDSKVTVPVDADTSELEEVRDNINEVKSELNTLQAKVDVDNSEIESLESELVELEAQRLELDVETDAEALEVLSSQIADIENSLSSLQASVEVDTSEIESLEAELSELEAREIELTVNVNDAGLDEVNSKLDETESKVESTSGSVDGLGSALTAVAGAAGLDQMVTTADNINNSWNRLSLTFAGTGVSIDQLKAKQSELAASTGQTGGTIRNFFNDMGIAGVTNTDLLSSAFESLSGKAYQTGSSVEEMEGKFQRMVMSGNASSRMLVSMGISVEDLARAMGVSASEVSEAFKNMTPEERIRALTTAMGDGKQANEMYKNSFQGLKTQAEAAFAGLMGAVGQAILPVVIPMLNLAKDAITGLTNAFKSLPGPVQAIIGGLGGVAMAGVAIVGALGVAGTAVKGLYGGFQTLQKAVKWIRDLEIATKLYSAAETIASGVRRAAAMAQAALNAVMAANPIFLVVIAIVALIAILWYLYNTNESVRAAIDGFIAALRSIGETIYGYLVGAFEWLQGAWQNTVDFFTGAGTAISEAITGTFTWIYESIVGIFTGIYDWLVSIWQGIIDFFSGGGQSLWEIITGVFTGIYDTIVGILGGAFAWLQGVWDMVVNAFMTYAPLIAQVLFIMATGGIGAIVLLIAHMNGMPNQVGAILQSIISRVVSWVSNLVSQFTSGAQRAVSGFLSPLTGLVESVSAELSAVYSAVMGFIQPLIDAFNALGSAAAWAFSVLGMGQGSPGDIYKAVKNELEWTTRFVEDDKTGLVSATGELGASVTGSFNPTFTPTVQSNGGLSDNNVIIGLLNELVTAVKNNQGNRGGLVFNHYGDVDTEERMQRILDYIIRVTDWDNDTAGRNMEVL